MRHDFLLALGILLIAQSATTPALARDPMAKDGKFTICAFQNFDKCELMTERTIVRYRLNTREKRTIEALRQHTSAKSVTLAALERTFGPPSKIFPHSSLPDDKTVAWFHNSIGMNDLNAKCPECGIYVYLSRDVVTSLNYIVDQKFTVGWNRTPKP